MKDHLLDGILNMYAVVKQSLNFKMLNMFTYEHVGGGVERERKRERERERGMIYTYRGIICIYIFSNLGGDV